MGMRKEKARKYSGSASLTRNALLQEQATVWMVVEGVLEVVVRRRQRYRSVLLCWYTRVKAAKFTRLHSREVVWQ